MFEMKYLHLIIETQTLMLIILFFYHIHSKINYNRISISIIKYKHFISNIFLHFILNNNIHLD